MFYVCNIDGNDISVIDTRDAVVEVVTREYLFDLRRNHGVLVAGMTDDSIDVCDGAWLEDEFFQWCVQEVNNEFSNSRFKSDEDIFHFLTCKFYKIYRYTLDLKLPQVLGKDNMWHFISDCIAEVCRLHSFTCKVFHAGSISTSSVGSKLIYKNLGIEVYTYINKDGKKAYRIEYLELSGT